METPKTYHISTIKELYETVTIENIERMCNDLILSLYLCADIKSKIPTDVSLNFILESFNWKDDGINQAEFEFIDTLSHDDPLEESEYKKITLYATFDDREPVDTSLNTSLNTSLDTESKCLP